KKAKELKAEKLATGHNLDDEAESVMMNLLRGNMGLMARLGPITGVIKSRGFIPRVKPLYLCREEDIKAYSKLMKFPVEYERCPYAQSSYREIVRNELIGFEKKYSETKENIINWFLRILPELKKGFKRDKEMTYCTICEEPSQKSICNACTILEKLENKKI
ncbi:MAG: TIGR00269 family protein, partial [Nanoarchaeota archaeon]|nr:TIGR00269 family protein [Nanoarchaeota archaeon]